MLTEADLKVGRVFEAKKPRQVGSIFCPFWNDRQIRWVGETELQYDSPSVGMGRHYPRVTKEAFLKWAGRDITSEMPAEDWRSAR